MIAEIKPFLQLFRAKQISVKKCDHACMNEHFFMKSIWRIRHTDEMQSILEVGSEQLPFSILDVTDTCKRNFRNCSSYLQNTAKFTVFPGNQDPFQIIGRHLIYIVVQPVGIQVVGMGAPHEQRSVTSGSSFLIIVLRKSRMARPLFLVSLVFRDPASPGHIPDVP